MNEFLQTWNDPHARHAALVHVPIALALLGILPALAVVLTGFKSGAYRLVAIACFAIASIGVAMAANAGGAAEEAVEAFGLTPVEKAALEKHEELGENGWIWPLIPAALIALTFAKPRLLRRGTGALAVAGAIGVAVWIGLTAHAGGRLVYIHGLGVPQRGLSVAPDGPALPAPAPDNDEDDD